MRKSFGTLLTLHLLLTAPMVAAQEEIVTEVSQDDLGNVEDEFQEYFFEALKQKGIENHEKAITALEKCLKLDPLPVVYFELGKNYNALERFSEASTFLEKARQMDKNNVAILAELYNTYFLSKNFEKAIPVVEELRRWDDSYSEDLANLYMLNERFDDALALLEELDARWGVSEYREGLRRQIYSRTGNVSAGLENLRQKIEENPEEEQHYLDLIFLYSETGDQQKAFETAEESLSKFPGSEMLHLALYKFYLDQDKPEKAVHSMKTVLKGDKINEEAKYEVLNDFLEFVSVHPQWDSELMEITELFSVDESNTKVFAQLGGFFLQKGDKEKALEYFEAGVASGEMEFDLLLKTLLLQLDFGKVEAAEVLSAKSLEEFPSQPILYLIRGNALNQAGKFNKAEEILTFGLDFLIDNSQMEADFYQQLSIAYKGLNNGEKASEFAAKVTKLKNEYENE